MKTSVINIYKIINLDNGIDLDWFDEQGTIKNNVLYNSIFFNPSGYLEIFYDKSDPCLDLPDDFTVNYKHAISALEVILNENGGYNHAQFQQPLFYTIKGCITAIYVDSINNTFLSLSSFSDIKYILTTQ